MSKREFPLTLAAGIACSLLTAGVLKGVDAYYLHKEEQAEIRAAYEHPDDTAVLYTINKEEWIKIYHTGEWWYGRKTDNGYWWKFFDENGKGAPRGVAFSDRDETHFREVASAAEIRAKIQEGGKKGTK